MSHHSRSRTRTSAYPPMSNEGHFGLSEYLEAAVEHDTNPDSQVPNIGSLLRGVPQGSILGITPDLGIQVKDTEQEGGLRSPRLMDPPGIALVRALILPGGSVGLNRKEMDKPNRRDYLHYRATVNGRDFKVPMLRIIADTQFGYQTPSADDHRSYRRGDLPTHAQHVSSRQLTHEGTPTKSPYLGREFAVTMALNKFDQNKHKLDFEMSRDGYIRMLRNILRLLDKIPLKDARL